MIGRQAAPGHQQPIDLLRQQTAIRDVVRFAFRQIFPARIAARVMLFDRRAALRDGIVELAGVDHIRAGESVFPKNAAAFAHADLRAQSAQRRVFIARHFVAQETKILQRLPPPFDLGARQLHRIRRVDARRRASCWSPSRRPAA